uniref:Phospholipase-like protein n=1 Tax=Tanacetum cinerariifolium TaxID=118510 RepID=A0A6L2J696_TANCI|nr:phospholipase-like protein [Tanacetum cinerariifolium]
MLGRQLELTGDENENIPLYYHVVDNFQIQSGREEFCLVTRLKFGVENWTDYNAKKEPIPFRRRVFCSSLDGRPIRGKNVKTLINSEAFKTLDDNNAVSLCCVGILQLVLLGLEDRHFVSNWILRLAMIEMVGKNILGVRMYGQHCTRQLPVQRLVPDEDEARSRWWVSSRAYFDGRNIEEERIPCHLNRNNYFEVPSEMYREFEEQRTGVFRLLFIRWQTAAHSLIWQRHQIGKHQFHRIWNICDRARREHHPSIYKQSPYTVLPPTTMLPKKGNDKTKKKGKAAKLSPLNLGNDFADENVSGEDVTITGVQQTDKYFFYEIVDPDKLFVILVL